LEIKWNNYNNNIIIKGALGIISPWEHHGGNEVTREEIRVSPINIILLMNPSV